MTDKPTEGAKAESANMARYRYAAEKNMKAKESYEAAERVVQAAHEAKTWTWRVNCDTHADMADAYEKLNDDERRQVAQKQAQP